jgi:hypothetical protein
MQPELPSPDAAPDTGAAAQFLDSSSGVGARRRQAEIIALAVGGAVAVGAVAQQWIPPGPVPLVAASLLFATAIIASSLAFRGKLLESLSSYRLAAAVLLSLSLASVLGTLVLQGKPVSFYQGQYGAAAPLILALRLDDLFHSLWFGGLVGLMISSLVLSALRRWPITRRNAGFFAVHIGLLIILAGAGISAVFAVKGRIHLRAGGAPAQSVVLARDGEPNELRIPLGASVQLEKFDLDRYREQLRVCLYRPSKNGDRYELKVAFENEIGAWHRLPGHASFRIKELLSDPVAPPATHRLKGATGEPVTIRVGETVTLPDGLQVKALRFLPHFTFDVETKQATTASDSPINPALEVEIGGPAGMRRWLFANVPGFSHAGGGPELTYLFAPGNAPPADAGVPRAPAESRSSAALLVIVEQGVAREELLRVGQQPVAVGEETLLVYEPRGGDPKSFRSQLLVRTGTEEKRAVLAVNDPLSVGDWSLYQANFDPQDPTYSGLEAVRDPGVPWVFAGFGLLFLGVPYAFYVRPRLRRKED